MSFRFMPYVGGVAVSLIAAGCNLVSSTGLQTDYSFDALHYASPAIGDPNPPAPGPTIPDVSCDPTGTDVCTAAGAALALENATFSCDAMIKKCVAKAEVRASEPIDLSKQQETSFPPQAIQFGVSVVEVKRLTYWIDKNSLNLATPPIEFYVAPAAAQNEKDMKATLIASVGSVPAKSSACTDAAYAMGDTKAVGLPVCSATLPQAGKDALASFVKDYKTPFQIIAHAIIVARPGDPVPSGSISFSARPTVGLKILD